ncbi:hypothetical protein V5799_026585 [Amblyomma americanum]|uniref:Uncharacterized protein n=1 Tax=Amblyomma americanum TaxID=6943 RepID=A0AAQ4DI56_AMBAM
MSKVAISRSSGNITRVVLIALGIRDSAQRFPQPVQVNLSSPTSERSRPWIASAVPAGRALGPAAAAESAAAACRAPPSTGPTRPGRTTLTPPDVAPSPGVRPERRSASAGPSGSRSFPADTRAAPTRSPTPAMAKSWTPPLRRPLLPRKSSGSRSTRTDTITTRPARPAAYPKSKPFRTRSPCRTRPGTTHEQRPWAELRPRRRRGRHDGDPTPQWSSATTCARSSRSSTARPRCGTTSRQAVRGNPRPRRRCRLLLRPWCGATPWRSTRDRGPRSNSRGARRPSAATVSSMALRSSWRL